MNSTIGLVIVNWNEYQATLDCLGSIERGTRRPDELVVVDNGSSDQSDARIARHHPAVRLVRLGSNEGYCKAANLGAAILSTDWLGFVNNDTVAEPDFLEAIERGIDCHPGVGLITPRIMRLREPDLIDNLGIGLTPWLVGYQIAAGQRLRPHHLRESRAFAPSGAALFISRQLREAIGTLDEQLDFSQDDVDLGFRAQRHGSSCLYLPDAVIHHYGSLSLSRVPRLNARRILRNQEIVLFKHLGGSLWFLLPLHAAYVVFQSAKSLRRGLALRLVIGDKIIGARMGWAGRTPSPHAPGVFRSVSWLYGLERLLAPIIRGLGGRR